MTVDDTDEVEPGPDIIARPLRWASVAGVTANFAANLGRAATTYMDDLTLVFAAHARTEWDRTDAIQAMHDDLEMLPTTAEPT